MKSKQMIKKNILSFMAIPAVSMFFITCSSYDIKAKDSNANSPLHEAVYSGDLSLVKKLIDEGADLNSENEQCVTPIRLAAYLREKEIVQLMIEKGVDVNYKKTDFRSKNNALLRDSILKYPEKKKNFFLTFDAGDNDANLDYILTVLKKYHITATFFITGTFLKKYPRDVKRILADGHVAGNHTFSHSFDYKSEDQLLNELYETEHLFKKVTGEEITRIWRAPYLRHNDRPWMLKAARKLGYRHIDVSLYSKDWKVEGDSLYLSNDRFVDIFRNNIDFAHLSRIDADGANYLSFRKKSTDYHGIIMLMHTGAYRKKGDDFVYTLEDVILQLISCGYLFDNCKKFED